MEWNASINQRTTPATNFTYYESPIGLIELGATADALTVLYFVEGPRHESTSTPILQQTVAELDAYFTGTLRNFTVPLHFTGTEFQRRVWQALLTVPYGEASSYQALANTLGNPKAVRAVGAANGQNPISIIAPCHRIIGSNGALIGYGGGLWRKEWLLRHEGYLLA
ncbi:MAG: methylated-DNA--[protein]-cysteine S-methyltransferase [Caldilineaceae bacterium]